VNIVLKRMRDEAFSISKYHPSIWLKKRGEPQQIAVRTASRLTEIRKLLHECLILTRMTVAQLVEFSTCYGTLSFITEFTRPHRWALSEPVESSPHLLIIFI